MLQSLIDINPNIQPINPIIDRLFSLLWFVSVFAMGLFGVLKVIKEALAAWVEKEKAKAIGETKVAAITLEIELVKKQRDADNILLSELMKDFSNHKERVFEIIKEQKSYNQEQVELLIELIKAK